MPRASSQSRQLLQQEDVVIFDARSRPEFGPVAARPFAPARIVVTEVNDRQIRVGGLFEMGTSFGIDGSLMTSDDNWLRLFPDRSRNDIQLGLIKLKHGSDAEPVRDRLREFLPKDVLVLTKADFVARENDYWNRATPIGYVFAFGAIMGFVVGAIIVYQILFADVSEHLQRVRHAARHGLPQSFRRRHRAAAGGDPGRARLPARPGAVAFPLRTRGRRHLPAPARHPRTRGSPYSC